VITQHRGDVITGPRAAELAGITYRQLDYWARQGWLRPTVVRGRGRAGRREYAPADVIRLAALAHLGRNKADVGTLGPALAEVELPAEGDFLIVADGSSVAAVSPTRLRREVSSGRPVRVFDPRELLQKLGRDSLQVSGPQRVQRTA
jgi:hypothetical protein